MKNGPLGPVFAHWLAEAEEVKKTLLADLTLEYMGIGPHSNNGMKAVPKTTAELLAQADPRYKAHLAAMVEARRKANGARVSFDLGKTEIDLTRTRMATLRAELGVTRHT